MNHPSKQKSINIKDEEEVIYLPTEYFFSSSRRLSTESSTPFIKRKVRLHQKSKTCIKATKKKFFNELCDKAYDILRTLFAYRRRLL